MSMTGNFQLLGLLLALGNLECHAANGKATFKLEGAYYREENGKLTSSCRSNSIPPETKVSYMEKFTFRRLHSGRIEVLHKDSNCSDMLFEPETYGREDLLKDFSFSADGLHLTTQKSIKPGARFRWLAKDPT